MQNTVICLSTECWLMTWNFQCLPTLSRVIIVAIVLICEGVLNLLWSLKVCATFSLKLLFFLIVFDCRFITCNFLPLSFINLSIAWSHTSLLAYLMVTKKLWKLTVVKCHASCQHRLVQLVRIQLRSHKGLGSTPAICKYHCQRSPNLRLAVSP